MPTLSAREYIKIDEANIILAGIERLSSNFDGAIMNTHTIAEYRKNKQHEMSKAKALSLSLLSDIQNLNELFAKKEQVISLNKRGRPKLEKSIQPKRKRGRPKKTDIRIKKMKKMNKNLRALKKGLRK